MAEGQPTDGGASNGNIRPPTDLPSFFNSEQKKAMPPPIVPPVPPQLHPFPQPTITVAPPTPLCPPNSAVEPPKPVPPVPPAQPPAVAPPRHPPHPPPPTYKPPTSSDADVQARKSNVEPPKVSSPATIDAEMVAAETKQKVPSGVPPPAAISVGLTEIEGDLTKLEAGGEGTGMFGWLQKTVTQSSFLSKVADKAKTSMDSVLTTLDPGMKDFLKSEGTIEIVIGSDNGRIINAIADGFRRVFTNVAHRGMGTPGAAQLLTQIVGYNHALKYVNERISLLRASGLAGVKSSVVVVQPFLHQIEGLWYDSAVIAVQREEIKAHVFTQPVPVDDSVIAALKRHTTKDFAPNAFATTVGNGYAEVFGIEPDDWQFSVLSFSSSELYRIAATALAADFKRKCTPIAS